MRPFITIAVFLFCSSSAHADGWRERAIKEIRKEKKVVETMFPQASSLWASIRDDGTRRDGYAEYLCLVLHHNGMPAGDFVVVSIWDAEQMSRGAMRIIGLFECEKN